MRIVFRLRDRSRVAKPSGSATAETELAARDKERKQRLEDQLSQLTAAFDRWVERARVADGPDVVIIVSDDSSYAKGRFGRSGQLATAYLDENCPVFYSCDQPKGGAVAESPDRPLLLECSIDMTTRLLPLLLGADFGAKKKVLHVAMPHELMVRYIVYARQHNWRVIYDAQTDWEELARLGGAPWYEVEFEWYVARTANLVSAVSYPLALKLETLAQRGVAVSPNGHDPAFPGPPPVAAQDLPVVGHFAFQPSRSFDWSLLVRSAKHYPGIQFELCGDWTRPSEPLPDNVKLLGSLSWQELAETTSRWKSAILPFRFGPLADSADPIELYEYLHLGLPVLASYLPQLQSYPNTTVTESPEEFVEGIKRVTLSRLQRHDHREWLADQTWERRVEAYRRACPDQTSSPPMADYLLNLGFS